MSSETGPTQSALRLETAAKSFGGEQRVYSHDSTVLGCRMRFAIYLPPVSGVDNRMPVLYWLSGLTCTETNFIEKAGAQRYAAELGLIIVCPDTSPRGLNLPGENDSYDFGTGASFYLDATRAPWSSNYRMHTYVTDELIRLVTDEFDAVLPGVQSISGHSMGGHGALICALRNPQLYRSASAFAPLANLQAGAWGRKALAGYLGDATEAERDAWRAWDATELVRSAAANGTVDAVNGLHLVIDQGSDDEFLADLLPDNLVQACREAGVALDYTLHEGYNHGYYFVASFIGKHLAHHRSFLKQ